MDLEPDIIAAMHAGDWRKIADLEQQLETTAPPPVPLVSAALYYASVGLKVFPLMPGLKIPYKGTQGFKDATTDPDQIRDWWTWFDDANLAIATGHLVDVIDIDPPQGPKSWAHLKNVPEPLGIVRTPRGRHIYIPATGRGNKAGIAPGIDYRGLGGYVVTAPSVNEAGVVYRWTRPLNLKATEE